MLGVTSKTAFKACILSLRYSYLTMLGRARADMFAVKHAQKLPAKKPK